MKNRYAVTVVLIPLILSCSGNLGGSGDKAGEENATLYTVGQMYARNSRDLHLTEKDVDEVMRGFKDWALRGKSEVDIDLYAPKIQKLVENRLQKAAETEKEKGKVFLEAFLKSGGTRSSSGLAYKIKSPGKGKKPKESDWVEVDYEGSFIDGRVFDSSLAKNQRAKFPLNQVIRGWMEGLQLIREGGEIELVVPPALAYGDAGSAPSIPGGSTLIFKIQLHRVH